MELSPDAPPSITVSETIRSGKGAVITWAGGTDPEGGAVSYEIERKINSGSFTQVYAGSALTYTDTGVGSSANTVQRRGVFCTAGGSIRRASAAGQRRHGGHLRRSPHTGR